MALVKEFYSNIYDPEDGAPKYCKVRGHAIRFDAETINDFLDTLVILADREDYPTYSQYLHIYPDHQAIAAKLCTPGGGFVLNANGAPWKLLQKDLARLAQTWSILSYFNLAPSSHTSDLNVDRAR